MIQMFEQIKTATPLGDQLANPGNKYSNGLDMISLNMALVFGVAGLPHLLIRFFTVKDAVTARKSVVYSTWFIGAFFLMVVFLGFGATAYVGWDNIVAANPAGNMAAPMLALSVGGDFLFAYFRGCFCNNSRRCVGSCNILPHCRFNLGIGICP